MVLPNLHHWLVDLEPFGLANDREVYVATTEPHGLIEATVRRGDLAGLRPMGRNAFSHLFIHVSSLPRSRAFYVDRLGLEVLMEEPGYLRVGGGEGFTSGSRSARRRRWAAPGSSRRARRRRGRHGLVAARRRARDHRPGRPAWGDRHAWTHDPDGYRSPSTARAAATADGLPGRRGPRSARRRAPSGS